MIFSYHWLKELSGTKKSPNKLAELLMAHAFEVETVTPFEHGLSGVAVGKVLTVQPHPDADRLRVATVLMGKKHIATIVCGAPNLAVGQKVAVALPGATLPGGIVIKEAELRGVKSQGMICSAKELGLGSDHTGILVLSADAPIGRDFVAYAGLEDTVLDVKILPDRSCDALSYRGLAREIAALEGIVAPFLTTEGTAAHLRKGKKVPKVAIKTERSKRYMAVLLEPVVTGPSPLMVQARLAVSGLRPMNALVDLTNYLMLETGQPVHAFDADAIPKGGIVVRLAKPRERLTLLDGTAITLSKDDLVIADTKKPLALAGVMGGKHSAISDKTKRVVFEIASFDAKSIRRTEKRHRMLTDAAYRYERGIDTERPGEAALLLARYARDWNIGGNLSVRDVATKPGKPTIITLELSLLESLLGTKIPLFQAVQACSWLGLSVKKVPNRSALKVTVPSRRPDLQGPEDLIEEIGRLHGYHTIAPEPLRLAAVPMQRDRAKAFERVLKTTLAAMGFDETISYSFYGEKSLTQVALPKAGHLALANPMNPDQAFMRASLFPGIYRALATNAKHFSRFSLFEFGSVYQQGKSAPAEEKRLALAAFGPSDTSDTTSFLHFKARLQALFDAARVEVLWNEIASGEWSTLHPARLAHLTTKRGEHLGVIGEINPELTRRLGSGSKAYFAELSVAVLSNLTEEEIVYREFSRFPLARRDISLIGPKTVSYADLEAVLMASGAPLLVSYELFDVFETESEKSFALHLSFGSAERTLSGDEMDRAFEHIVATAKEHLGFRLKM
ncbi:MAG: phenylalanine--tRNA ligase subunit beta [Candidatus Moraniibacteriota bacterium]